MHDLINNHYCFDAFKILFHDFYLKETEIFIEQFFIIKKYQDKYISNNRIHGVFEKFQCKSSYSKGV